MQLDPPNIIDELGDRLQVRVTPKAAANRVKIDQQSNRSYLIRVYVTVVPEGGKANREVIKLLAKEFKIPQSSLVIIQGIHNRDKTILINR